MDVPASTVCMTTELDGCRMRYLSSHLFFSLFWSVFHRAGAGVGVVIIVVDVAVLRRHEYLGLYGRL